MPDMQMLTPTRGDEALTMIRRSLRLSLRNVDGLIIALALPIMLMLIFVYLFGGAVSTVPHYVDYVVPGVLLVCAGFGAGLTAVSVSNDLSTGIIDRFRSIDVRAEALIGGHVVASVLRNLASTVLVLVVAFAIGFRTTAGVVQVVGALAVLALFVTALSWLCAALGIAAKSPEAANGMTFFVSFLPYASSAFVPIRTMPSWLQGFARQQPITSVADTLRRLFTDQPVGSDLWQAVAWSIAIMVASIVLAGGLFRRRTA